MQFEVRLVSSRTCLANVPLGLLDSLDAPVQSTVLELRLEDRAVLLGLSGLQSADDGKIEVDNGFAHLLGLSNGVMCSCDVVQDAPRATSVLVAPKSADDWEVMELNSGFMEVSLLSQLRVVECDSLALVYVGSIQVNIKIIRVDTEHATDHTGPACLYGDSEIIVAPVERQQIKPAGDASTTGQISHGPDWTASARVINYAPSNELLKDTCMAVCLPAHARETVGKYVLVAHSPPDFYPQRSSETKKDDKGQSLVARAHFDLRVPSGHVYFNETFSKSMNVATGTVVNLSMPPAQGKPPNTVVFHWPPALRPTSHSVDENASTEKASRLLENYLKGPINNNQSVISLDSNSARGKVSWNSKFSWTVLKVLPTIQCVEGESVGDDRPSLVNTPAVGFASYLEESVRVARQAGGLLICGSSGSGKSKLLTSLKSDLEKILIYVVQVDCKIIADERLSKLREMMHAWFCEAEWNAPSAILLDNLDSLFSSENENQDSSRTRALSTQLFGMLRKRPPSVALIATAQSKHKIHPLLASGHAFLGVLSIRPPARDERLQILHSMLEQLKRVPHDPDFMDFVRECEGFLPGDLQALADRARFEYFLRTSGPAEDSLDTTMDDLWTAKRGYTPISLEGINFARSNTKWDEVGGLDHTKQVLLETLEWPTKYAPIFAQSPLRLRSGILLYGYPGCGKSLIASAVAAQSGLNFISVKGPEVLNKYIGASEQSVRDLFTRASNAKPCILFLDEFDSIAPKRGHDSTGVTDRVVNQLLTQMDGAEGLDGVYVLAATSRPDLIDAALLRPGRLDKSILCGMPTVGERASILRALSKKMRLDDDIDIDDVASRCELFSGADLQALLYNAQLLAIRSYTESLHLVHGSTASRKSGVEPAYTFYVGDDDSLLDGVNHELAEDESGSQGIPIPSDTPDGEAPDTRITISFAHLIEALSDMRPSTPISEYQRLTAIYREFVSGRKGDLPNGQASTEIGGRETLM